MSSCPAELRAEVFARAGHRCENCGRPGHQAGLDPSHRIAASRGGPWALWNLAALCRDCHRYAHRYPLWALERGWFISGFILRGEYRGEHPDVQRWLDEG